MRVSGQVQQQLGELHRLATRAGDESNSATQTRKCLHELAAMVGEANSASASSRSASLRALAACSRGGGVAELLKRQQGRDAGGRGREAIPTCWQLILWEVGNALQQLLKSTRRLKQASRRSLWKAVCADVLEVLAVAERAGRFASAVASRLVGALREVLFDVDVAPVVAGSALKLLHLILQHHAYCAVVRARDARPLFVHLAWNAWGVRLDPDVDVPKLPRAVFSGHSSQVATVLAHLMCNCAGDMAEHARELVFPFFTQFWAAKPPLTKPTIILTGALGDLLNLHGMTVVGPLRELVGPLVEYAAHPFDYPALKIKLVHALFAVFRVHWHLPPKKGFSLLANIDVHHPLYTVFTTRFVMQPQFDTDQGYTADSQPELDLQTTTFEMLTIASHVVAIAQQHLLSGATPPRPEPDSASASSSAADDSSSDEDMDASPSRARRKRKRGLPSKPGLKRARSSAPVDLVALLHQSSDSAYCVSLLKFYYVFALHHQGFFEQPAAAQLYDGVCTELMSILTSTDDAAARAWSLACLSRLALSKGASTRSWTALWDRCVSLLREASADVAQAAASVIALLLQRGLVTTAAEVGKLQPLLDELHVDGGQFASAAPEFLHSPTPTTLRFLAAVFRQGDVVLKDKAQEMLLRWCLAPPSETTVAEHRFAAAEWAAAVAMTLGHFADHILHGIGSRTWAASQWLHPLALVTISPTRVGASSAESMLEYAWTDVQLAPLVSPMSPDPDGAVAAQLSPIFSTAHAVMDRMAASMGSDAHVGPLLGADQQQAATPAQEAVSRTPSQSMARQVFESIKRHLPKGKPGQLIHALHVVAKMLTCPELDSLAQEQGFATLLTTLTALSAAFQTKPGDVRATDLQHLLLVFRHYDALLSATSTKQRANADAHSDDEDGDSTMEPGSPDLTSDHDGASSGTFSPVTDRADSPHAHLVLRRSLSRMSALFGSSKPLEELATALCNGVLLPGLGALTRHFSSQLSARGAAASSSGLMDEDFESSDEEDTSDRVREPGFNDTLAHCMTALVQLAKWGARLDDDTLEQLDAAVADDEDKTSLAERPQFVTAVGAHWAAARLPPMPRPFLGAAKTVSTECLIGEPIELLFMVHRLLCVSGGQVEHTLYEAERLMYVARKCNDAHALASALRVLTHVCLDGALTDANHEMLVKLITKAQRKAGPKMRTRQVALLLAQLVLVAYDADVVLDGEIILDSLVAPDFAERLITGLSVCVPFQDSGNGTEVMYKHLERRITEELKKDACTEAQVATCLAAIGQLTVAVDELRASGLYRLFKTAVILPNLQGYVQLVFQQVARAVLVTGSDRQVRSARLPGPADALPHPTLSWNPATSLTSVLGTPSVSSSLSPEQSSRALLEKHIDYILVRWITPRSGQPDPGSFVTSRLMNFPAWLFGQDSPQAFLQRYMRHALPAVVVRPGRDLVVPQLAMAADMDQRELLRKYFPEVFARWYALYSAPNVEVAEQWASGTLEFLLAALSKPEFEALCQSRLSQSLVCLADVVSLGSVANGAAEFNGDSFCDILERLRAHDLVDDAAPATVGAFLCNDSEPAVRLVLHLKFKLLRELTGAKRHRTFVLFCRLVSDELGPHLARPTVFRSVVSTIIPLMHAFQQSGLDEQARTCCNLLAVIVTQVLKVSKGHAANFAAAEFDHYLKHEDGGDDEDSDQEMSAARSLKRKRRRSRDKSALDAKPKHLTALADPCAVVGALLPDIVSALVAYLQHDGSSPSSQAVGRTERAKLVNEALQQLLSTERLRDYLPKLAPFPKDVVELQPVIDLCHTSDEPPLLEDELQRFVDMVVGALNTQQHGAALTCSTSELLSLFQRVSGFGASFVPVLEHLYGLLAGKKPEVAEFLSQKRAADDLRIAHLTGCLIGLCGAQHHADVRRFAGLCLGEVGLVDPDLMCRAVVVDTDARAEEGRDDTAALTMQDRANVVHHLRGFLDDPDPTVNCVALDSLKHIFRNKDGPHLFAHLDERSRVVLLPFAASRMRHQFVHRVNYAPAIAQPGSVSEFCSAKGKTYAQWVSGLTCALIDFGRDKGLMACRTACKYRPSFAAHVLQYALYFILADFDGEIGAAPTAGSKRTKRSLLFKEEDEVDLLTSPDMSARLAQEINKLMGDAATDTLVLQALFRALQFVRERHADAQRRFADSSKEAPMRRAKHIRRHFVEKLDFLAMASAAQRCSAYFTSLRLLEEWYMEKGGGGETAMERGRIMLASDSAPAAASSSSAAAAAAAAAATADHRTCVDLLVEVYRNVDDPDGIAGVVEASNMEVDLRSNLVLLQHEGQWARSLQMYDALLQDQAEDVHRGVAESLRGMHCSRVLNHYAAGALESASFAGDRASLLEMRAEAAWRSLDFVVQQQQRQQQQQQSVEAWGASSAGFHHSLLQSLKAMQDENRFAFDTMVTAARSSIVESVRKTGPENLSSIFPHLGKLQQLADVEMAFDAVHEDGFHGGHELLMKRIKPVAEHDFQLTEGTLTLRAVLLRMGKQESLLAEHLVSVSRLSREANDLASARAALYQATSTQWSNALDVLALNVEGAELSWASNEPALAIRAMRRAVKELKSAAGNPDPRRIRLATHAECLLGYWLSRSHFAGFKEIDAHLQSALQSAADDQKSRAHYELARFHDQRYQGLVDEGAGANQYGSLQMAIDDTRRRIEVTKEELKKLRHLPSTSNTVRKLKNSLNTWQRQVDLDEAAEAKRRAAIQQALRVASEHYMYCLAVGDAFDHQVLHRIVALWFRTYSQDTTVTELLASFLGQRGAGRSATIPVHKFLPLLHQISSRLTIAARDADDTERQFRQVVRELMFQLASRHPQHSLYQIFAIFNADEDGGKKGLGTGANPARIQAAKELIVRLKGVSREVKESVDAHEVLIEGLCELASKAAAADDKKRGPRVKGRARRPGLTSYSLSKTHLLRLMDTLRKVPMPTKSLPSPTMRGAPVAMIEDMERKARFAPSGVTRPLILTCRGSDGQQRRILLKSNEDMRQDAVMQQIFSLVNGLLARTMQTRRRKLAIRTYNVVPLSPLKGMLEWVENTMSLADYLVKGNNDAHTRYREKTGSMDYNQCRELMKKARLAVCSAEKQASSSRRAAEALEQAKRQRLAAYRKIMHNFRPVFRYFFLERYVDASAWFAKRLAYTRSVAVNNIVGYIVGIGDRHTQNILIDTHTAELVHIDFGIAFEQGRLLPAPERVPFRLTRDTVDGMGVTGFQGAFRRSSEETLRVMRANQDMLLTVLEVFIHDPLYDWTLSDEQLKAKQKDTEDEGDGAFAAESANGTQTNTMGGAGGGDGGVVEDRGSRNAGALRALHRVKAKLQGIETGDVLSVEGQVLSLIQEAQDVERLVDLFEGWSAWL